MVRSLRNHKKNILDNKICTFKILLSCVSKEKQRFRSIFPLCPPTPPPPLKSANSIFIVWESAKASHKRVFALLTPEIRGWKMAQMLQKPVFALPGCRQTSVNTLLCDTLGLAERRHMFWISLFFRMRGFPCAFFCMCPFLQGSRRLNKETSPCFLGGPSFLYKRRRLEGQGRSALKKALTGRLRCRYWGELCSPCEVARPQPSTG